MNGLRPSLSNGYSTTVAPRVPACELGLTVSAKTTSDRIHYPPLEADIYNRNWVVACSALDHSKQHFLLSDLSTTIGNTGGVRINTNEDLPLFGYISCAQQPMLSTDACRIGRQARRPLKQSINPGITRAHFLPVGRSGIRKTAQCRERLDLVFPEPSRVGDSGLGAICVDPVLSRGDVNVNKLSFRGLGSNILLPLVKVAFGVLMLLTESCVVSSLTANYTSRETALTRHNLVFCLRRQTIR